MGVCGGFSPIKIPGWDVISRPINGLSRSMEIVLVTVDGQCQMLNGECVGLAAFGTTFGILRPSVFSSAPILFNVCLKFLWGWGTNCLKLGGGVRCWHYDDPHWTSNHRLDVWEQTDTQSRQDKGCSWYCKSKVDQRIGIPTSAGWRLCSSWKMRYAPWVYSWVHPWVWMPFFGWGGGLPQVSLHS